MSNCFSMMTGWSNQSKTIVDITIHHSISNLQR